MMTTSFGGAFMCVCVCVFEIGLQFILTPMAMSQNMM